MVCEGCMFVPHISGKCIGYTPTCIGCVFIIWHWLWMALVVEVDVCVLRVYVYVELYG